MGGPMMTKPPKNTEQKGAALLTVLVALLLMSLMTLELQYTSLVERKLAYNDLNHIQAQYLAKSGVHLALLRVVLYGKAKKQFPTQDPRFLTAIWSLPLPAFPPTAEILQKLAPKEKAEQEEMIKDTRITTGQFSYQISSESSKLNVNLLQVPQNQSGTRPDFRQPPTNLVEYIGSSLLQRIEQIFLASEDPTTEFGNVRAEEVIYNIMDWISPTPQGFAGGNTDSWYEQQVPPYKVKRGPLFTLDELKLVKDMSPALFEKLKSSLTVYSENGRIDLDTITQGNGLRQLFPDFSDRDIQEIRFQFGQVGGTWGAPKNFYNLCSQLNSRFTTRYPDLQMLERIFTVGSESFMIKSQGQIKKSGSVIQKNIVVAVALQSVRGGCAEIPGKSDPRACNSSQGFISQGSFKCYRTPQTYDDCRACESVQPAPVAAFDENTKECQVFENPNTKKVLVTESTTTGANAPTFSGVKVYSWVES